MLNIDYSTNNSNFVQLQTFIPNFTLYTTCLHRFVEKLEDGQELLMHDNVDHDIHQFPSANKLMGTRFLLNASIFSVSLLISVDAHEQ